MIENALGNNYTGNKVCVNVVAIYCILDQLNAHFAVNNLTRSFCKKVYHEEVGHILNLLNINYPSKKFERCQRN